MLRKFVILSVSTYTSVGYLDSGAAVLGRVEDRVADDGGAVAVFEGGAVGTDVPTGDDGVDEVVEFVDEGVLPADDVAVGPPDVPERVVRLGDEDVGEAGVDVAVRLLLREVDLELVHALEVEGDRALLAVDLEAVGVLA